MNILIHFLWILVLSGGSSAISEDSKRCKDEKKLNDICGEHTYQSISPILRYVDQLQKQTDQINELQAKAQLLQQRETERTFMVDLIAGKNSHIEDLKARISELLDTIRDLKQNVKSVNHETDSLKTFINGELHREHSFTDPNAAKLRYCEIELNKKNIFISESTVGMKSKKVEIRTQNVVNEQENPPQLNTEVQYRSPQAEPNDNQDELEKQEAQDPILKESQFKLNEYSNVEVSQNVMVQQKEHHVSESASEISQLTLIQNQNQNAMAQQKEHHLSESSSQISHFTLNQNQNVIAQQKEHHVSESSSQISHFTLNQNQNQNVMAQQKEHNLSESSSQISHFTLNQNQNVMAQHKEHHASEASSEISHFTLNQNQNVIAQQKEHHVSESSSQISHFTLNQNQNQNVMAQQKEHNLSESSSQISHFTLNQNQNVMAQHKEHHASEASSEISHFTLNQNLNQNVMAQQKEHNLSESSSQISHFILNQNQDEFAMQKAQFRTQVKSNDDLIHKESQTTLNDTRREGGEIQTCNTTYANSSGIHSITIPKIATFPALCNSEIAGPGWTVIEQRINGKENFTRTWKTYQNGFGDFTGDFFLGLEKIHLLTNYTPNELYIHMEAFQGGKVENMFNGSTLYARYDNFSIAGEDDKYSIISLGNYSGSEYRGYLVTGYQFTTFDNDNDKWDGNCGQEWKGGWWYTDCGRLNPNGKYYQEEVDKEDSNWWIPNLSLKSIIMMIRPRGN